MSASDLIPALSISAISRRRFLQAGVLAAGLSIAGCRHRRSPNSPVKIGFVSPQTGEMAAFGEADAFVLAGIRKALAGGLAIAGVRHPVHILVKDSRSDPNRAAEVASQLILRNSVDLLLAADTPETVNPVSDQAEINEVPCITTEAPWQPCFFGRGATASKPFDWTYHFFWGLDDLMTVYIDLWESLPTNRLVGFLWANDTNGTLLADPKTGFPPRLDARGFRYIDPGRFEGSSTDFSAQIWAFKRAGVEIVTGGLPISGFAAFWSQAAQQSYRPKIVTIAKALLMPAEVDSLGGRAVNLSTEIWWSPDHPFRSSVTGQTAAQLCADYERRTGRQWTPIIGFKHALFSVAIDVLQRTANIDSPQSIVEAIRATNYESIVGPVNWRHGPVKNVCTTPLVGGQWVRGTQYPYDLIVVNNRRIPRIPVQAKLQPLAYPEI